jgi:hypothetical protein
MQKRISIMSVLFICCFMVIPFVSTGVLKVESRPCCGFNVFNSAIQADELEYVKQNVQTFSINVNTLQDSIRVDLIFPQPTIHETSNGQSVEIEDMPRHNTPGEPILPFKPIKILIPQGKEPQTIEISKDNKRTLEGRFNLEYGKTPMPISSGNTVVDQPNQAIYSSANPFPGALYSCTPEQMLRGYGILAMELHPVQYIPKTGELFYYETMTVTVNLKETDKTSQLLRNLPQDRMLVQSVVDNPDGVKSYIGTTTQLQPTSVNASESYSYVVITSSTLNSSFQPLIDWKIEDGLNATIVLREDIVNDPDYCCDGLFGDGCGSSKFNDTAARIRNFIKDAYQNWGTEYVLLGGDTEIIPTRGVYSFVATDPITVDKNIPCDMYYGALDGSWDNDNDTIFGEGVFEEGPQNGTAGEEADFFAEVYIGRAPVNTPEQAENFVNKTLWYEQASDDSYFKKALMIGSTLDEETEAANNKDMVTDIIPQYTTTRLYDRDKTYSRSAIINAINSGTHILNHDGHTNTNWMMELDSADVDTVITNTEYFFGYSVGCYAAAIDADSVIEHFVRNPEGAFAFVGNSRYGWYIGGTTMGPGDRFDRSFFSVLNNTARNLGKTLQFSKENLFSSTMSSADRWTYFELNLLGDPETDIVTAINAPTAHFDTNPTAKRLDPPVIKGLVNLTGRAMRGTAVGATFQNFTIESGAGTNPSLWYSSGIELAHDGQNEIVDDTMATWDTRLVSPGIRTLKLTVRDVGGKTGEDRWIIRVEELPAIRVDPQLTETQEGLTFTVSVKITDPEDLYGLDFQMNWNTTLLDYINHSLYIPVEDYWWGVLHEPVVIIKNELNQTAGTYWVAATSSFPASPFDRDGTVFDMTFQAKANGTCDLGIFSSNLSDSSGEPIVHNVWNGTVEIAPGVHDVAVTDIWTAGTIVGEGYPIRINVTVTNEGTFPENFTLTVYANETVIDTTQIYLSLDNSETATVIWDTSGWTKGNYNVSAYAGPIPSETDTADNTLYADMEVSVSTPGDVDGDGDVDIYDIVKICACYGLKEGDPQYDGNCDIDGDGDIDIYDIVIICSYYGT